jgi:hypothetical protein
MRRPARPRGRARARARPRGRARARDDEDEDDAADIQDDVRRMPCLIVVVVNMVLVLMVTLLSFWKEIFRFVEIFQFVSTFVVDFAFYEHNTTCSFHVHKSQLLALFFYVLIIFESFLSL